MSHLLKSSGTARASRLKRPGFCSRSLSGAVLNKWDRGVASPLPRPAVRSRESIFRCVFVNWICTTCPIFPTATTSHVPATTQ